MQEKLRAMLRAMENELNALFFERDDVVRGLLVGLLSRHHVLLLGPPGTAKSALAEELCSRIGGRYFRWLLARTSTPEELFGPISLKGLEQDCYRRVTGGKLPEAHVAFVDEIFKCNSAVLNSMLSVLNERLFFNDGSPVVVPLQMAVGASNELPEDREELSALWDRFLLRYVVNYIRDPRNLEAMLFLRGGVQKTVLTGEELREAQERAAAVDVQPVVKHLLELRQKVVQLNISVSDRRWRQGLDIIRANAYLNGHDVATEDDLDILAAVLWQEPGQINQIRELIMELANPYYLKMQDLSDAAMEVWQDAISAEEEKSTVVGSEANAKLKRISKELEALKREVSSKDKDVQKIEDAIAQVNAWNREVIHKCLGITT